MAQAVAELCAGVMAAAGFKVYFLDGYRSTPELSFAVRFKHCSCGIMVTASHNPPSDNAVKVYWAGGVQVLPPHDKAIIERVMNTQEIRRAKFEEMVAAGKVVYCQDEIDKKFQQAVLTQEGAPQLTAEQIVANSDANIERIKTELKLTPEQEKHWTGFNSAMRYLGHNGADRLNLRIARAKRDPPDDIIEQMRNEAQFLNDRAVDQRNVADAAEPLFASLDDKQKAVFIEEMVRLSHERGLD